MADIVERLRDITPKGRDVSEYHQDDLLILKAADEIERLREALYVISTHPVEQSKQWEIGAREMQKLARLSLEEEWGGRFNKMAQALGYFLAIDEDSQSSWKYGREEAAKLARTALGEKE